MPKTNPDIKSKVGNVNHPFSKRENETALKMWGSHPARQAVVNGQSVQIGGGAVYDALQEFKNAQTNFGANAPASVVNPNQNTNAASVALPEVKAAVFGSGTYENPQNTTDSNANDNSNSINPYSFQDDKALNDLNEKRANDPNRNKFGFWKRNKTSLEARIKQAKADGKLAKQARLEKKLKNFENNQEVRSGKDQDGNDVAGADPTFGDKINPKNWL
jgi:hypothetical protein